MKANRTNFITNRIEREVWTSLLYPPTRHQIYGVAKIKGKSYQPTMISAFRFYFT